MDVNLQFWSAAGKSFFQRLRYWANILDPTSLGTPEDKIEKSRSLLQTQTLQESLQDETATEAWKLSLSSVNPSTGEIIPLVYRAPAFLPIVIPLAIFSLSPRGGVKQTFMWQFLFHVYTAGFAIANGNGTAKADKMALPQMLTEKQLLLSLAAVTYSAGMGVFPKYVMTKNKPNSPSMQMFFGRILPFPLFASLCAFNVLIVRGVEYDNGIEVMDKNGNVIGVSQKAGMKAVQETALSRAALFGTAVIIPEPVLYYLQRTNYFVRNPNVFTPLRMLMTISALGLLIPVSFSMFPQLRKIKCDDLEKEILSSTEETELFYYRGV